MSFEHLFERVIKKAGGPAKLARALDQSPGYIWQIKAGTRPLPPSWCEPIEALTGITAEKLRPDLMWIRDAHNHLYWRIPT